MEENITAHCFAGSAGDGKRAEGWEQQGGEGRAEENLTPGSTVPGLGGNSLRAIFQSHLCSPGTKGLDPGNAAGREDVP